MYVHQLVRQGDKARAVALDNVMRVLIPVTYLIIIAVMLLMVLVSVISGVIFLACVSVIVTALAITSYQRQYRRLTQWRTSIVASIREATDPVRRTELMRTAFKCEITRATAHTALGLTCCVLWM
jgi:MFS superfamily sulfate permease-like transporter